MVYNVGMGHTNLDDPEKIKNVINRKKEALVKAGPATKKELMQAAGFYSPAGLHAFMLRHNAIVKRTSIYSVKFPEQINLDAGG